MSNQNDERVIAQTKKWLHSVIIDHNYCPFAKRVVEGERVRYRISHKSEFNSLLDVVIQECVYLDQNKETETTLIILPSKLDNFNLFLDCLALAEDLLVTQGYQGIYQIASFHPHYCFQGADETDAANYTNRSPYPMMHLLREDSLQLAIEKHPNTEGIPERNIEYAEKQGLEKMKHLLAKCMEEAG